MTGVLLQRIFACRRAGHRPRQPSIRRLFVNCLITGCSLLALASGCRHFGSKVETGLPVPSQTLDLSQLDAIRYQSPQSGQAGTPGVLNRQSHRMKLDGPVLTVDEGADRSQIISAVKFRGNRQIPLHQLRRNVSTRPGRYYDPDKLQQDVQELWRMPEIERVNGPYVEQSSSGIIVTFEIEERNTVAKIEFIGNRGINDNTLRKESGLEEIGHLDVHRIRMAKSRIEELYRERGYPRTQVEIKEGNESSDSEVVFLVHEDQQQRIWKVDFEGNELASDGRLRSLIEGKPGILKIFGGLAKRDVIDQDIVRLESYYKSLGYFNVQIGREINESNDGRWLSIRFIINEGPRYKIRDVRFVGNQRFRSEDLIKLVNLKPGEGGSPEFNSAQMSQDVVALRDLYGENGFVYADVQAEPRFLEEPGLLDMVYRISEGEQYRVGRINVHFVGGNGITKHETIRNYLSLRPGDLIDSRLLRNDERRLTASRLFANGQQPGAAPPRIVVRALDPGSPLNRLARGIPPTVDPGQSGIGDTRIH